MRRVATAGALAAAVVLAALVAWAALAPLPEGPREVVYIIPKGTAAQRSLGTTPAVLPAVMRFTLGVRDVLVLRNEDETFATFGPVRLEAGQTYRVPFRAPARFQLACSVHQDGQVGIVVTAPPQRGWERAQWRLLTFIGR